MALFDLNQNPITEVPHADDYNRIGAQLSAQELTDMETWVDNYLTQHAIVTAAQMVPPNFGQPFTPVLRATNQNQDLSSKWIGLFLWAAIMDRPEDWFFKNAIDDEPERGKLYWRP